MIQFKSALLALAADFRGRFAPYEAIGVVPHPAGGVFVAATDNGSAAIVGYDPTGIADRHASLLPSAELIKAARGIKTAERVVSIELEDRRASVTTIRKTNNETKEFPILEASSPFPPLDQAVQACLVYWNAEPPSTTTTGRYSTRLLAKAMSAAEGLGDSVSFCGSSGGPLRLDIEGASAVILVMPQFAKPVAPVPDWLNRFAGH